MTTDQYSETVPAGLCTLPDLDSVDEKDREVTFAATWYECDGILLADIDGDDPRDAGLTVDDDGNLIGEVLRIDNCLKRGNSVDGFYHA